MSVAAIDIPRLVPRELDNGTVIYDYERHGVEYEFPLVRHLIAASTGAPVWKGDFSTGNWSQWGAVEWGGTFDNTPPLSDRLKCGPTIDGFHPPNGLTNFGEVIVGPGDQYGGSSGERTLLRQYEPIRLIPQGYDSWYVLAIRLPIGFPAGSNLWISGMDMHQTKASYVSVTGPAPFGMRGFDPASGFEINLAGGKDGARNVTIDHLRFAKGYDPSKWQIIALRYKHDPYHGAFELQYGQEGDTSLKSIVNIPDGGTSYADTQSYPLFGLYRAAGSTSVIKMHIAGCEYPIKADALAYATSLLGSGAIPPTPTIDIALAKQKLIEGISYFHATDGFKKYGTITTSNTYKANQDLLAALKSLGG